MCGIAGGYFSSAEGFTVEHLDKMLEAIATRGPDDRGTWTDGHLFMGHNRLSILDLSDAGHQPMVSDDGQFVLVFNGERYNYRALKRQLEQSGISFRSDTDTEVLLYALVVWGIDKTLAEVDGMFAFAFWNNAAKQLFLARDRVGEKPLYWGEFRGNLVFASELSSIQTHYGSMLEIDPKSLDLFLQFSYIPAPYSIYKNISKLLPGHYVRSELAQSRRTTEVNQYWQFAREPEPKFSEPDAVAELEGTLASVLRLQLAADVPVGAFLSGGIDSSLIAAMISRNLGVELQTFSIGFENPEYDESGFAKNVAQHIGTRHHEHIVSESDMLKLVPKMAEVYSEPFADSSQIPTYLLCQMARQEVTVALSGDAADELFFGYTRYQRIQSRWEKISRLPRWSRHVVSQLSRMIEDSAQRLPLRPKWSESIRRGLRYSSAVDFSTFYRDSMSADWNLQQPYLTYFAKAAASELTPPFMLMDIDYHHYLPEDILVKVDRASMAHSLEVRVPYLGKPVLEFVKRLDMPLLFRQGRGKWLLRSLLSKYVPTELVDRPKRGFAVPMKIWLRGAMREWAEELLQCNLWEHIPTVDHQKYRRLWRQHQLNQYDWSGQLWNYLQLLSWLRSVHLNASRTTE